MISNTKYNIEVLQDSNLLRGLKLAVPVSVLIWVLIIILVF